jgi:hypothetical protein
VAIEDDIGLLERGIRELQIEWEKFFGGVEKKPPLELRARIEGLIKRYAYADIRNNSERFKYQSLTARYNTFNELWNKRLRALEEGRPLGAHAGRPSPPAPAPRSVIPDAPRTAEAAAAFRVERTEDGTVVRALFNEYVEARKQAGDRGGMNFENFQKVVKEQTKRILTEKNARAVDFRLEVKEGKVTLKAKPIQ